MKKLLIGLSLVIMLASVAGGDTILPGYTTAGGGFVSPADQDLDMDGNAIKDTSDGSVDIDDGANIGATLQDTVADATTNGTTTITKAGENFSTTCAVGDAVYIYGGTTTADYGLYLITTVTSDTALVLSRAVSGSNADVDFYVYRNGVLIDDDRVVLPKQVLTDRWRGTETNTAFGSGAYLDGTKTVAAIKNTMIGYDAGTAITTGYDLSLIHI